MEKPLVRGEKIIISKFEDSLQSFILDFSCPHRQEDIFDVDVFAFMINGQNQVAKKNIIFYNQPMSTCGSLAYHGDQDHKKMKKTFTVDLKKVPANIEKIAFACSFYKEMSKEKHIIYPKICLQVYDKIMNEAVFELEEEVDLINSKSMIFGDIYRYKGNWKFNTVKYQHQEHLLYWMREIYTLYII
ncbi:TerD family protein [Clostridiaceae bacterium 35-E11]